MDPLLTDILDQPRALRAALARGIPLLPSGDRILLCGMGASYFAGYPAFLRLLARGSNVAWVEAGELLHFGAAALRAGTTLVLVSQSGRSAEVVRLLEARGGSRLVAVTNDPESPLGRASDILVPLGTGPELAGVATKTFTASLLVCDLLAGGAPGHWPGVIAALAAVLEGRAEWLPRLVSVVGGREHVFFLGRGPALAAALTGGLMLQEAGALHGHGLSEPQFRHGPLEAAGPGAAGIVLVTPGPLGRLDLDLAAEMAAAGMAVAALLPEDMEAPAGVEALPWPCAHPAVLVAAAQCLAHACALARGIVPGTFTRVGKVTVRE